MNPNTKKHEENYTKAHHYQIAHFNRKPKKKPEEKRCRKEQRYSITFLKGNYVSKKDTEAVC